MFIAITFTLYIHTLDYYSAKKKKSGAGGGLIIDTCYKTDEIPEYYSKGKKSQHKRSHIA